MNTAAVWVASAREVNVNFQSGEGLARGIKVPAVWPGIGVEISGCEEGKEGVYEELRGTGKVGNITFGELQLANHEKKIKSTNMDCRKIIFFWL